MKARVCQLFEVRQHEFANLSLPCEGRLREALKRIYKKCHFFSLTLRLTTYCEENFVWVFPLFGFVDIKVQLVLKIKDKRTFY